MLKIRVHKHIRSIHDEEQTCCLPAEAIRKRDKEEWRWRNLPPPHLDGYDPSMMEDFVEIRF